MSSKISTDTPRAVTSPEKPRSQGYYALLAEIDKCAPHSAPRSSAKKPIFSPIFVDSASKPSPAASVAARTDQAVSSTLGNDPRVVSLMERFAALQLEIDDLSSTESTPASSNETPPPPSEEPPLEEETTPPPPVGSPPQAQHSVCRRLIFDTPDTIVAKEPIETK